MSRRSTLSVRSLMLPPANAGQDMRALCRPPTGAAPSHAPRCSRPPRRFGSHQVRGSSKRVSRIRPFDDLADLGAHSVRPASDAILEPKRAAALNDPRGNAAAREASVRPHGGVSRSFPGSLRASAQSVHMSTPLRHRQLRAQRSPMLSLPARNGFVDRFLESAAARDWVVSAWLPWLCSAAPED